MSEKKSVKSVSEYYGDGIRELGILLAVFGPLTALFETEATVFDSHNTDAIVAVLTGFILFNISFFFKRETK